MTPIQQHIITIQKLCVKHKVKQLFVFGSVLTNKFTAYSDIDFIVNFIEQNWTGYTDNYFDFKFTLETLLNRKIDLIEEEVITNPYFINAIKNTKQLIYEY